MPLIRENLVGNRSNSVRRKALDRGADLFYKKNAHQRAKESRELSLLQRRESQWRKIVQDFFEFQMKAGDKRHSPCSGEVAERRWQGCTKSGVLATCLKQNIAF